MALKRFSDDDAVTFSTFDAARVLKLLRILSSDVSSPRTTTMVLFSDTRVSPNADRLAGKKAIRRAILDVGMPEVATASFRPPSMLLKNVWSFALSGSLESSRIGAPSTRDTTTSSVSPEVKAGNATAEVLDAAHESLSGMAMARWRCRPCATKRRTRGPRWPRGPRRWPREAPAGYARLCESAATTRSPRPRRASVCVCV